MTSMAVCIVSVSEYLPCIFNKLPKSPKCNLNNIQYVAKKNEANFKTSYKFQK